MMRNFTKQRILLLIVSLVSIMSFFSSSLSVLGDDGVSAGAPTKAEVYKGIPTGIDADDYIIHPATYNDGVVNSAKSYPANSSEYGNPYDIFEMMQANDTASTDAIKTVSSIWGKRETDDGGKAGEDNYFDLTKHQTISVWIYFGNKDPYTGVSKDDNVSTATGLPDGMAFVLQDDKRGSKAIATSALFPSQTNFGEGLGVWGTNTSTFHPSSGKYAQAPAAIQNSWAIEFDTLQNNRVPKDGYLLDNFFDGMTYNGSQVAKGQHMAWNYPGGDTNWTDNSAGVMTFDPNSSTNKIVYMGNKNKNSNGYFYGMNHRDVKNGMSITGYGDKTPLIDNSWQNFTLTYDPPTEGSIAHISYVLNNKRYDGSIKPYTSWNAVNDAAIDISPLEARGNTKVRWGFTASSGSTGSKPSDFAIVMQEMPNFANIENTTNLTDLSEYDDDGNLGREISDLDKKDTNNVLYPPQNDPKYTVGNHDKLRFDYNLKYISGFAGTGNEITTTLDAPANVDFVPDTTTALGQNGNIGQIIYSNFANSSDNKIVPIPASALSDGKITLSLQKMTQADENTKIELYGQANAGSDALPVKVLGAHASYRSMRYIDDDMSRSFMIVDAFQLKNRDNLDLGTINTASTTNNSVNLNLTANYEQAATAFDNKGFTLYTQVDEDPKTSTIISTTDKPTSKDIANDIVNSTLFNAQSLKTGKHTIKVYAVDSLKRVTNVIEYNVEVIGKQLTLTVSKNLSFKDFNYKTVDDYVRRNGKWVVTVNSTNTPWTLSVSGDDLQKDDDSGQTIGPMIYRDKSNNEFSLATQKPRIAYSDKVTPESVTTDVSGNWGTNDGILLKDDTVKPAGHYKGQLSWDLIDSVTNS